MQCKDIDAAPILAAIAAHAPATWFPGQPRSIAHAFPAAAPDRLRLAKLRSLIRRGIITGCACGCRGDFRPASH